MVIPDFLTRGDGISIVSPASSIIPDYVNGSVNILDGWALSVNIALNCFGKDGIWM